MEYPVGIHRVGELVGVGKKKKKTIRTFGVRNAGSRNRAYSWCQKWDLLEQPQLIETCGLRRERMNEWG